MTCQSILAVLFLLLAFSDVTAQRLSCKIDLLMLVDGSGSITDQDTNGDGSTDGTNMAPWNQMTDFMVDVVRSFSTDEIISRIQPVMFGNKAVAFGDFVSDRDQQLQAVADLKAAYSKHNTNMSSALEWARTKGFNGDGNAVSGDRPNVPNVIILFSDGKPNYGLDGKRSADVGDEVIFAEVRSLADQLKARGTTIITVAVKITDQAALNLLRSIGTESVETMNFDTLSQELDKVVQRTCENIPEVKPCRQPADVYFVLDSSGSIKEQEFKNMKQYVVDVIHQLPIDDGSTKVGLAYWSETDELAFDLNKFNTIYTAGNATLATTYMRSETNTAAVLRYLRETGFTSARGDRGNVPNIVAIMTDGNSNVRREDTLKEAFELKKQGVHVIVIGIGDWFDLFELQGLASDPYPVNYIHVRNTTDMTSNTALRNRIKALLCNDVDECQPNPCQPGSSCQGTCVDKIGSFTCLCPGTCAGQRCERDCSERMDVVFALDASSSMQAKDFREMENFVGAAAQNLNMNSGDHVGVMKFSLPIGSNSPPEPLFQMNTFDNIIATMNGMTMDFTGGRTNTYDAISMAMDTMFISNNGDGSNRNVLVVITDGRSMSFSQTWEMSMKAREDGVIIIVVAIGSSFAGWNTLEKFPNIVELQAMASGMGNTNVFYVDSFSVLPQAVQAVSSAVCNNVGECENMNCQNGGTTRDHIGYCDCDCPEGSSSQPEFSGRYCERSCTGTLDIILIIDSSGSIRRERFVAVLRFLAEFVENYPMRNGRARFGAIYFSDTATIAFSLNQYEFMEDVITHLLTGIPFLGGRTNIADALDLVPNMLSSSNGGRSNAPDFVFLITDGVANIKEDNTIPSAILLRESGVRIGALGIGDGANTLELRGIASEPTDRFLFLAPSFNDLLNNQATREAVLSSLVNSACDSVNECDASPCVAGNSRQCFDEYHRYVCECNIQRAGRTCERTCPVQLDVALVLDLSGSLDQVFEVVIAFAKEIVHGLPNDARVAAIGYDTTAEVSFLLNRYLQSKESILNALSFRQKPGRRETNTEGALRLLNDVFSSGNGARSGTTKVAILVTDGGSNVNAQNTIQRAQDAKNNGVRMFVAALGNMNMQEVNGIASDPDATYVTRVPGSPASPQQVRDAASTMLDNICAL